MPSLCHIIHTLHTGTQNVLLARWYFSFARCCERHDRSARVSAMFTWSTASATSAAVVLYSSSGSKGNACTTVRDRETHISVDASVVVVSMCIRILQLTLCTYCVAYVYTYIRSYFTERRFTRLYYTWKRTRVAYVLIMMNIRCAAGNDAEALALVSLTLCCLCCCAAVHKTA